MAMAVTSLVSVANAVPSSEEDKGIEANRFTTKDDQHHTQVIGKLTDALLEKLANSKLCERLTSDHRNYIEKRIHAIFPTFHTPDHPTYAMMIQSALDGLKEKGGSTEEAISEFIQQKYQDLPVAHTSFLRLHLKKLSERDEIIRIVSTNRYMLPSDSLTEIPRVEEITRKRKVWQDREKGGQKNIENGDQSSESQKVTEERSLKLVFRKSLLGQVKGMEIVDQNQCQIMQSKDIRDKEEWNGRYVQEQCPEVEDAHNQPQRPSYEETGEYKKMEAHQAEVVNFGVEDFENEVIERQDGAGGNEIDAEGHALSQKKQIKVYEEDNQVVAEQINDEEQPIELDEEINQEHTKSERIGAEEKVKEQCVESEGQKVGKRLAKVIGKNEVQRNQVEEIGENDSERNGTSEVVLSKEQQAEEIKGYNIEMIDEQHHAERYFLMNKEGIQSGKNQKQPTGVFTDQNQCLEQQNRQHPQISVKETVVIVAQQSAAEGENIAIEKQILEQGKYGEIQEQYQTKGLQSQLHEGKKQPEYIKRLFQLQEEQIDVITNIIKQEAQQKKGTAKLNMLQEQMNSGSMIINTSRVPELSKKQEKGTTIIATCGSFASQKSAYHGSLPTLKICIELLKRNRMIEDKLLEVMNLRDEVDESKYAIPNPIAELDGPNLQSQRTCGDREYMTVDLSVQKQQQAFSQTRVYQPYHDHLQQVYGHSVKPPACQIEILQSENPDKEKPIELESEALKESCLEQHQMEGQLQLSSCTKGKSSGCQVGDQQLTGSTIQEKPSEFELMANEQSCQTKREMRDQQKLRQLRPREQRQYRHDCAESKIAAFEKQQIHQEQGSTMELETIKKFQKLHLDHDIELPSFKGPQETRPMFMENLSQPNGHEKGEKLNSQLVQDPDLASISHLLMADFQTAIKPSQNKRAAVRDLSRSQEEPKQKRQQQQHIPLDFSFHNASHHGPVAHERVILALPVPNRFERPWHFQYQVQGNPSKSNLDSSTIVGESLPSDKLCDERHFDRHNQGKLVGMGQKGRCLRSSTISETIMTSPSVDNQSDEPNQLEKQPIRRRGRPPKSKQGTSIMTKLPLSAMHHNQQPPKRLGRPPKLVATHVAVDTVTSQQQPLKHEGRGRPQKVTEGT